MLVLNRKEGERIEIGDGVIVIISRISGKRVSVGIDAPPSVKIRRAGMKHLDPGQSEANQPVSAVSEQISHHLDVAAEKQL